MQITQKTSLRDKKLVVFDLDGTLAPTKSTIDSEMAKLLENLLKAKKVAVIGGGKFELFQEQLLDNLKIPTNLFKNLFLFPTTATTFYHYQNGWQKVYAHDLTKNEVERTINGFNKVIEEIGYKAEKTYGAVIENRGSQVTWSALGQDIVKELGDEGVRIKNKWKEDNTPVKLEIAKKLQALIPDLEVHAAGYTSIDVTKKGIDKAYGLRQMESHLKIKIKDMIFVGDAIFPGGNDYAVTKTPIDYAQIEGPEETKEIIRKVLEQSIAG